MSKRPPAAKKVNLLQVQKRILALLTVKQKRRWWLIVGAILINTVMDVGGLAAILPLVGVAQDPAIIQTSDKLNMIYQGLGFTEPDQFLLFLVIMVFVLFLVKNLGGLLIVWFQTGFAYNLATDLSRRQYLLYYESGFQEVRNIDTGNFITNVRRIPALFAIGMVMPFIYLITELAVMIFVLGAVAIAADIRLLIMLGGVIGVGFLVTYRATKNKVAKLGEQKRTVAPGTLSRINESLRGYTDITIFNKIQHFLDQYLAIQRQENQITRLENFYKQVPKKTNELVAIMGIVIVFVYGIFIADDRSGLFLLLSGMAVAAYRLMPSSNRVLATLMAIKSHTFTLDILDELNGFYPEEMPLPSPLHFEDSVEFRNLGFSYETGQPVLKSIDLKIKKGELVGFVGESGSGKTTLMRILLRLLKEDEGNLLVDGVPVNEENKANWRANLGYVQQDIFILEGTLLENVAFGAQPEEVDRERVKTCLSQACLDDFVAGLDKGIDTFIGEMGSKLSGGQKQRLAIARSLYQNAQLFVFDEATSALDSETEAAITESISRLADEHKTIFIIAHRITTLRDCNRIFELAKGEIVNEYKYDDLLKTKLGLVKDEE